MTVKINKDGMLTIQAETEIEKYALKKWCEDNITEENQINALKILFKWG